MDILNSDMLLYLVNIIKLDDDKNLTLMYWSWTNKYYHDLIKPLIDIDEVILIGDDIIYDCIRVDGYDNYKRYNPYWVNYFKLFKHDGYEIVKINNLMYKNRCITIGWNKLDHKEKIIYDKETYYKLLLTEIYNIKDDIDVPKNKQKLLNLMKNFKSLT